MNTRLFDAWDGLRSSYWFIPALMSFGAVGLAFATLTVDRTHAHVIPSEAWWLYGGGPSGARAVLAAIVGSMISVVSVVFSITIVALTLAAGQFGSRILRSFMRDRANQLTLGTFIATFLYALLVLRTIRDTNDTAFVPPLSVTVAVLLVVSSMGVLIFFIHHVAESIQADSVLEAIARDLDEAMEHLHPERSGRPPPAWVDRPQAMLPEGFADSTFPVRSHRADYLRGVEDERLMRVARERDLVIRLRRRPGNFVVEGGILAEVWPAGAASDDVVEAVREAFVLGRHRALTQDPEFGVHQLVEIAARALSPGVNDPYTAISAIDRLTSSLCRLAGREMPSPYRLDGEGRLRVVADVTDFAGYMDAAFHQIRQYGGGSPAVLIHLVEGLRTIAERTLTEEQRESVRAHADLALAAGEGRFQDDADRGDLRRRHAAVLRTLEGAPGAQPDAPNAPSRAG